MSRMLLPLAATLAGLMSPLAASQAVTFLQPEAYEIDVGQPLRVHITEERRGVGERAAWPADEVEWLFVRAAGTQSNLHELPADEADATSVTLEAGVPGMVVPGILVVGIERRTRVISVPGSELREWLALRVAPDALPDRWRDQVPVGSARVRRVQSSKLLVRVRDVGVSGVPPSSTAQSKTGQRVEIRLLADPTRVPLRHDLPLKVYLPGPRPDRSLVIARHTETGRATRFFTGPGGTGFFTLTGPGLWTVEVHGARPVPEDDTVDWELVSATFSFEVPVRDDRRAPERQGGQRDGASSDETGGHGSARRGEGR